MAQPSTRSFPLDCWRLLVRSALVLTAACDLTPKDGETLTIPDTTIGIGGTTDTSATTADTSGDTSSDTSGDTSGDTASDTSADTSGDTAGDTATDTASDTAGDTAGDSGVDADGDNYDLTSDCDDTNAAINPGAREICDPLNVDENCDGLADDADPSLDPSSQQSWYPDEDGDMYGASTGTFSCDPPVGSISASGDCDDTNAAINPDATEVCDPANVDENCNGLADDADGTVAPSTEQLSYPDADGDGWGTGLQQSSCDQVGAAVAEDCDDGDASINPGATEICSDGIDNNCLVDCGWLGTADDTDATQSYTGATASGGSSSGFLGGNIAGGADLTGDGYPDVVVADRAYDTGSGYNQGRVYLLSGSILGLQGTIAAPTALLTGDTAGDRFGGGVGMVSDLNQDGVDELLVGASTDNTTGRSDCGSAFLFHGPLSSQTLTPADADIRVLGDQASDYAGWVVNGAGDVSGDGTEDWLISAYFSDSRAGTVAVVSGTLADGSYDLGTMNAVITGVNAEERFGTWAVGAIDLNGDGFDDLAVASLGSSSVSLFFGPVGSGTQADADATITGVDQTENTTSHEANCINCVASAGDPNGDGYEDLLLGADGVDQGAFTDVGAAFLMNGPITTSSSTSTASASFFGTFSKDYAGRSVAGGGDLNADGLDDLLVSEHGYDIVDGEGRVGLGYGPLTGSVLVTDLPSIVGTESEANLGAALAIVGDVNADGFDDFMLGAPNASDGNNQVGRAWFFEGAGE